MGVGWVSVPPLCVLVLPRTCLCHAALHDPALTVSASPHSPHSLQAVSLVSEPILRILRSYVFTVPHTHTHPHVSLLAPLVALSSAGLFGELLTATTTRGGCMCCMCYMQLPARAQAGHYHGGACRYAHASLGSPLADAEPQRDSETRSDTYPQRRFLAPPNKTQHTTPPACVRPPATRTTQATVARAATSHHCWSPRRVLICTERP